MLSIKQIIKEELQKVRNELFITEGKAEELISKFPELQPAYDAGIKNPQYLQWIQKRSSGEPIEDVIGVVKSFDEKKTLLKSKGKPTDIFSYKSPAFLRQALEDVGTSKSQAKRELKSNEADNLGEFGDWKVYMPHTKESSCELGKGTTWCTAATQSKNLFLSYVGRKKENIILYYIIKKGADSRVDPTAKLSVGFVDGEPVLEGEDGNVSVDANNKGLTERRLQAILGVQFEPIMSAMEEHTSSIENKHPAKKQMEKIAKDPVAFEKAMTGFTGEERKDFIKQILEYDVSPQILMNLSRHEDKIIRSRVISNPSIPAEVLVELSDDEDSGIRASVAENTSTPPDVLEKLTNDPFVFVVYNVSKNTSTPKQVLENLAGSKHPRVRQGVAINPSSTDELLIKLADDKNIEVRKNVALNTSTPIDVLKIFAGHKILALRSYAQENPTYIKYLKNQKAINEEKKSMLLKQIIKEELQKVLNERKEMVDYHVKNKIPFSQNIYREGSENYFIVISEARKRYKQGTLKTTNKEDIELFENSDLGEWAIFEGERVPLDFPMWDVTLEEAKKKKDPPLNKPMKNTGGGKKWKVYVRSKSGGIKKITYGDAKGGLKGNWNDPEARKSFAARHKCAQKKDKTTPGYWACRAHKDFGTNVPGRFW